MTTLREQTQFDLSLVGHVHSEEKWKWKSVRELSAGCQR